jgi:hypothetical protein
LQCSIATLCAHKARLLKILKISFIIVIVAQLKATIKATKKAALPFFRVRRLYASYFSYFAGAVSPRIPRS